MAGSDLWLDAELKKDFSFVSHGHGDHVRAHRKILATPATACFHALRVKQREVVELEFRKKYTHDGMTIELYPAGHILGSAMICLEKNGATLLYTGDFKVKPSWTAEALEIPAADVLIMECTFGRPEFRFHQKSTELVTELVDYIEQIFKRSQNPVILAYSLGKAQEAMKLLGDLDYKIQVHQQAWRYISVYEKFGVKFRNCNEWNGAYLSANEILILPPHLSSSRFMENTARARTILLSGWAKTKEQHMQRYQFHHAIPFSDHADFDDLILFVRQVKPKKIFTTHGFEDFSRHLNHIGFKSEVLKPTRQLILF